MNRETIIQIAREAGLAEVTDTAESLPADYVEALAKLCALAVAKEIESRKAAQLENADLKERLARSGIDLRRAVAKEREECAKVCESRYMGDNNREDMEARQCAAAIRARGEARMSGPRNLDATVFVYEHKTTGEIKAFYHESAVSFNNSQAASDWTHVGTLEPRMWIQAYWKDVV